MLRKSTNKFDKNGNEIFVDDTFYYEMDNITRYTCKILDISETIQQLNFRIIILEKNGEINNNENIHMFSDILENPMKIELKNIQ